VKPGWFLIGFLLGAAFGAGSAVVFLEWAVRQHYERAAAAEVRAWEAKEA
jgi:gas vesicle protein